MDSGRDDDMIDFVITEELLGKAITLLQSENDSDSLSAMKFLGQCVFMDNKYAHMMLNNDGP